MTKGDLGGLRAREKKICGKSKCALDFAKALTKRGKPSLDRRLFEKALGAKKWR